MQNPKEKCTLDKKEKCMACQENEAKPAHMCPYADEINGDESLCNCCESCMYECAMNI